MTAEPLPFGNIKDEMKALLKADTRAFSLVDVMTPSKKYEDFGRLDELEYTQYIKRCMQYLALGGPSLSSESSKSADGGRGASPPKSDRNPQVVFQPSFFRGKRAVQLKLRECTSKFISLQKLSV